MSNRQDPDFLRELSGSEKFLSEAAAAGKRTAEAKILNVLEFFGPLESNLQELTTVDGTSIWAGDGVHLTSNAHQSRRQKDDGIRHRRRDRRASQQTGEAGIGDTGEVRRPLGGQACAARASAAAQAGAAETHTREASCAGDGATTRREEASRDRRGRSRPGAGTGAGPEVAAQAAGAAGEASQ